MDEEEAVEGSLDGLLVPGSAWEEGGEKSSEEGSDNAAGSD